MRYALRISVTAILLGTSSGWQDTPRIDSKAEEVVRATSTYLRSLTSFRLKMAVNVNIRMEGWRQEMSSSYRVAMQRPNRVAITQEGGFSGSTVVCDGEKLYTYVPLLDDRYAVADAPESVGEIADHARSVAMGEMADGAHLAAMLIGDNPHELMMQDVTALVYGGREDLDGITCHRLEFSQEEYDWQLWLELGERPVPRKLVVDMSKLYEDMWDQFADAGKVHAEMMVRYDEWLVNADLPAEQFAFVPPEGAIKVDSIFDDAFDDPRDMHPLVGRSAPGFRLELLDGSDMALRDHHAQDIVILDFWATWCVPCVQALPILAEVAEAYRDQGVVFYAVNEEEDPETIRTFLQREGLNLRVALDPDSRVGDLYGVDGIPQTVVIGKDGTVQVVHVGFAPELKERLGHELESLLAGVNLADSARMGVQDVERGDQEDMKEVWAGAGPFTMRNYRQRALARDRATLLDVYKRSGVRDDVWDEAAIDFIDTCLQIFNSMPGTPTMTELKEAGLSLVDLGCNDPLVLYGVGYAHDRLNRHRDGEKYLRAAVEGLQKSEYSKRQLALTASLFARYLEGWNRNDEAREFHQIAADAFLEAAQTTPGDWFEQRILTNALFQQVKNHLPADIAESLTDRLTELESLDPCTLHTVLGKFHLRKGWDKRGGGFADTVTDDGWSTFRVHMEIARDHFEEAYRLDPTRPEAATEMIEIAMAGHARSGEDERFWFKRAVTAQIDWPVAYGTMRWALRPRWGGSYDAMYRFGLECMQSGRYDTDVPFQLIRALLDIAEDNEGSLDFWVTRDVQPVVNEVLTKLADRPEHTHRIVYYRTHAAGFAWATQRYEEASERIKAVAGSLDEDALAEMRLSGRRILDDVAIFTSPVAERVAEADEAFEWGRPALAIEGYAAALAETAAPDVVGPLRDRLVTATILRDFMSGEWVPLQFERGLPGWRVRGGIWHASVPEAINGGPNSTGLRLICQAPVGARFELRGRINMKNLHYLKSTNAAIYFRYRENRDRSDWQAFQIYNVEKRGWIGYRFWKVKGEYMPIEEVRNRLYEFHLKLWDTHATLRINGKPVFAGRVGKGDSWTPGSLFGLGGSYNGTRGYAVFDNLELRRLLEPPQALAELLQREQEWP